MNPKKYIFLNAKICDLNQNFKNHSFFVYYLFVSHSFGSQNSGSPFLFIKKFEIF